MTLEIFPGKWCICYLRAEFQDKKVFVRKMSPTMCQVVSPQLLLLQRSLAHKLYDFERYCTGEENRRITAALSSDAELQIAYETIKPM
jgi:hypothetical protein